MELHPRRRALRRGKKAIIALPSTAAGGRVSRVVPYLARGAGVVTDPRPRGDGCHRVGRSSRCMGARLRDRARQLRSRLRIHASARRLEAKRAAHISSRDRAILDPRLAQIGPPDLRPCDPSLRRLLSRE